MVGARGMDGPASMAGVKAIRGEARRDQRHVLQAADDGELLDEIDTHCARQEEEHRVGLGSADG